MSSILREYVETFFELYIRDRSILKKFLKRDFDSWGFGDTVANSEIKDFVKKKYKYALRKSKNDPEKAELLLKKMLKDRDVTEPVVVEFVSDFSMSGLRRMQGPGNLRSGVPTRGSHSSIQNDLGTGTSSQSAVVVLVRNGNKILAVSRGEDLMNLNMPGGGIEQGETPIEAATRELKEETGIESSNLLPLFVIKEDNKLIHVFKAENFQGELRSSPEGVASWERPEKLLKGQYANTFKRAIKYL